jgi:FAD/FMN-containing dehydrogenase
MLDGLWTMWDATILMRAPLAAFYDSLTPAQQAQLGGAAADTSAAGACTDQRNADWPADRIQSAIGASEQQRLELAALRRQASELAKFLAASCPREAETTPLRRLAAVSDRMNALMYVVMNMNPAFNAFYGSLDDRQRREFDTKP